MSTSTWLTSSFTSTWLSSWFTSTRASQLVHVHPVQQRGHVDLAEHGVQIDARHQRIDIQRIGHQVDDPARDLLGEPLRRVGHPPACRPQPVPRIHATEYSHQQYRQNHPPGMMPPASRDRPDPALRRAARAICLTLVRFGPGDDISPSAGKER